MTHHTHDQECPACEEKLEKSHASLVVWFQKKKAKNPKLHISWSHRDKDSQEEAYSEGKTKLHYPNSKHNKLPAEALDLFELNDQGIAIWNPMTFADIASESEKDGDPIMWGGRWKTIGDTDHFQYKPGDKNV